MVKKRRLNLFGMNITMEPAKKNSSSDVDLAIEGGRILKEYFQGKQALDRRIVENNMWWKARHWELFRSTMRKNDPEPVTMYLFNMIANKHADAMDNYPTFNILARKKQDEQEAKMLSKIIPAVYESARFRRTYSNAWWYKLKNGAAVYGVFWDPDLLEGLGDIAIKKLDILNIAWQPGVEDVQDGRNFFIIGLVDDEELAEQYKDVLDDTSILESKRILMPQRYVYDDNIDVSKKSVMVDWYRKERGSDGRPLLKFVKFVGNTVLFDSDKSENMGRGLYDHGQYPVNIDVLFPEEGYPTGIGLVDIAKNPQMYVDKFDQIISKNALIAGRIRWLTRRGNDDVKNALMDLSQDVIEVDGSVADDHIRPVQAKALDQFIIQHRQHKIQEMKEITANDVFTTGEGGKGVTAARAIYALQEAGNKLSRDMIGTTYENLSSLVYQTIELIRQFYDKERDFRIRGDDGTDDYVTYTNAGLRPQQLPPAFPNEGMTFDPDTQTFIEDKNYQPKYRKPVFDVTIVPERKSPFSTVVYNEMAMEMFGAGFFNPQRSLEALLALELMSFDGKEKMAQKIAENGDLFQQMQQQMAMMQQQNQQEMDKMWEVIRRLGGEELLKSEGITRGPVV